ncbi:polysaccharide lyase family 8 super-sandwich domain-containing protein [Paenibacillus sp. FSL K6-1217]|uniref:polysaccharide lyase family 8 super-sandwich domain-containing protein n=1 Tax=Paenibacillus sp. FSL K6-1217 TaxID=2921466 RepID=UPI0032511F8E
MTVNMQSRIKRWVCLVMVGLMISTLGFHYPVSADGSSQELAEMKLMKQRVVDFYISKDIINDGTNGRVEWTFKSQAGTYLSSQKANGSWADVDYTSTASSANGRAWSPYLALDRMQSMAQAFADPKSPYYHNEALLKGIQNGLDYWFTVKPTSTNWWETGIGKQLRLSKIALLCEGYLTTEQAANIVGTLDSKPNTIDGANSSWYNQNYMIRGLLLEDAQNVRSAVEAFNVLSAVTETLTGIQSDMSFFMHGKTNYTTGYGRSFARDMSFWAYVVSGTSFAYSQAAIDSLSSYLLDGTRYLVRGDVADLGMGMNGPEWPDYESSALTFYEDPLQWMQAANPKRADEFAVFLDNIRNIGTVKSNGLDANNMTQWQTLVSSHMRKDYGITVKMSSSTVKGGEFRTINPNGYNLLYWTPQGATAIQRTGDEYRTVYPLMDWTHVPGTTAPNVFTKENNFNNPKTFVGGVTNERYGATAFDFNKLSTSGKKGYFFFDDEMVALGAGITSTNAAPVHTTLNQSLAVGDVLVDGKVVTDETSKVNGRWAYNDNTGYVFPDKTDFQVKQETKTGKWSDVVSGSSTEPITKPVFSMWLDHGVKPVNASYQYIVLPGKTAAEVGSYAEASPISILANTPSVQAVRHRSLGIAEMLFYQPGTVTLREGLTVTVDKPSMVIVDESADPVRISVANPETPGITVNVTLNRNGDQTTTTYRLGKDTFTGRSETLSEGASIDDSGYDLAYSKGAAASSSVGKQFASNANDLYRTSSWSSNASDNEWIYVDLQDQYMINKVRLHWEKAYGKSYKIQVSDDGDTWKDVYATSMGDGGIDDIAFGKTSARFVRMQGVQQGTGDGYSLAEFNVYEALALNLAEGKTVIASSSKAADVAVGNAVDGSLTTRWGSNYADPQWIYVDLGASQPISKVMLHWESSYGKEYRIEVSDTMEDWKTVYSTANGDGEIDEISVGPVNARYVRMYGTQRASKYGYSLWEFKVFGPETQQSVPARMELEATPSVTVGGRMSVTGTVYGDGELPVPGVEVELTAAKGSLEPAKVTTDVYGKFSTVFTAPSVPGEVSISAILPASPSVTDMITVYVEEETAPVSARIELGATPSSVSAGGKVSVTGTVYDGEELPLAGAGVEITAASGSFEPALAITDENGRFSTVFTAPSAAGDVVITAVLTGNPSVTNTVTVSVSKAIPVPALIELQAAPSAVNTGDEVSITGIVSGSDHLAVSGVEVELAAASGNLEPAHAVTDVNGRFSAVFTAPSTPGEVAITAVLSAYPSITGRINVSVNERSGGGNGGDPGGEAPATPPVTVPPVIVGTPSKPDESPQAPATPVPGPSLTDIAGHWAEASIREAVKQGIITGYPNGSFQPNRNVTRAEFTVMLANALKLQNAEAALSFKDSDRIGPWAKAAIARAVSLGIIQGDNNSNFRPDAPVTRAEMAVMLARALRLAPAAHSAGFADDRDIPAWAVGAAAEMKKSGLMQGKGNNNFFPKDAATRAETVTVLLRMLAAK